HQPSNHNDYMQTLVREAGFPTNTSSVHDGQSKNFSIMAGTNIADGKGNITAYLEYRHALPVYAPARDFSACELANNYDDNGNILPNICIGTTNSNHFGVGDNVYSVVGNQLLPFPQPNSSPPPQFNSNRYISLSREDQRYNAGFMAHVDINSHVKPYLHFFFMNDKSTSNVAPSGLFYPAGNTVTAAIPGVGGQNLVNCDNPLLSAQEVSVLCGNPANVINGSAVVDIGRRNIE